ncbi:hypothetical protein D3C72_1583560 [compost metagenome]
MESAMNAGGHLADGKLKAPFGMEKSIRIKAHFAVYPERHARRPAVEAFLSWLHSEAAKTRALSQQKEILAFWSANP